MDVEKLKQKILDLAIRGKLVPQDPNDEPASALIEKIKAEKAKLVKEGKIKASKEESYIFKGSDNFYYEKIGNKTTCIQDEIPFEIPDSWEWRRLENIGSTNIGLTYSPDDISDTGIIVLRSSNIKNGRLIFDDLVKVNKAIKLTQYVQKNDLIICARNGSKSLVGKCAIIDSSEPMTFGAFMAIFRTVIYEYVYYYFNSTFFRSYFENDDNKQINQVTQEILKKSLIPVPPFKEQQRIVEVLKGSFEQFELISENLQKIWLYKSFIKLKILDIYFGENSLYKSYYPSCAIKDVCKLENGVISNKGPQPYLEAKAIRGTKVPEQRQSGIFIEKGTKVILVDGENSGEIMTAPFNGYMGSTFKIFSANLKMIDEDYLSYFILLKKQELREAKTGSAIPHLNKKLFNQYEIMVPPLHKQKEIAKEITTVFNVLNKIA